MVNFRGNGKNRKIIALGLDGVPYSLLSEYMERGLMPEFSELCQKRGRLCRMKSSLPEVSSVAWSGFMTGKNPGQHGIFGFMEIDKKNYEYIFPNFHSLQEKPFWEREGVKAVIFNIPQTYPAKPMNGVLVSGFIALDLRKATYPNRIYDYLSGIGYRIDVDTKLAMNNAQAFFKDLFDTFEKRKQAIEYLYEREEWDLFVGVITETDRLHHYFFDSAREGTHFDIFSRLYRELDAFIGHMARKADADGALFLLCSDHGFFPIKSEVYLNRWLIDHGYLRINGNEGLKGISGDSRAFCLDPSRIYVHLQDKFSRGRVGLADYNRLLSELKEELSQMVFAGDKVVKEIFFKEEIFQGKAAHDGPDLYILPNPGFDLKGGINKKNVFGTSHLRGMHTYDDALFFSSVPSNHEDMKIESIANLILSHWGSV